MSRRNTTSESQAARVLAFEDAMRRHGQDPARILGKLLRAEEVAELLSMPLGSIRQLTSRREIPCVRPSPRTVRYRLLDLLAWIEERSQPALI